MTSALLKSRQEFSWQQQLVQGRTGHFQVAGLPRHEGILGRLLADPPPADVCQSTTDLIKMSGLPRHGLWPCWVTSSRPGGAAWAVTR